VPGAHARSRKQSAAQAAASTRGKDRQAELGALAGAREMRRSEELEVVAPDAEHCVATEIDALDIGAYRSVALRNAEAQPAIVGFEREKMLLERGRVGSRELCCKRQQRLGHCPTVAEGAESGSPSAMRIVVISCCCVTMILWARRRICSF